VEVRATTKGLRGSAQKVRRVTDAVRGKNVADALTILRFLPTPTARQVAKVVKSAAANAENNFQMSPAKLRIIKVFANEGSTMKRFRPRSRGRVSPILKRSTHITVIVEEV
jgi:large subunit ribosomal protein L22